VPRSGGSIEDRARPRGRGVESPLGGAEPQAGRTPSSSRAEAVRSPAASPLSPELKAALARVPADDRESTRALVKDLARQGAPQDLLAWHVARRTPGASLPPVASATRTAKPSLITSPAARALPARIEQALATLSPEGRDRVETFARSLALAGLDEEVIGVNIARHLGLVTPADLRGEGKRWKRRALRDPYMTHQRQILLARLAIQPGRTCDLAVAAGLTWKVACAGLFALLERGYVVRQEDDKGAKVWSVTKAGTAWINDLVEIRQGTAEGPVQALFLLEEKRELRAKLMKLGWNYDQCRDVVPHYTLDSLSREFNEVGGLHVDGLVWNPGGLLWWRLGIPVRGKKWGKQRAGMVPRKLRWAFVDAAAEQAKGQATRLRTQGLATKVVPDGLGGVFLEVMEKEPFHVARRLAYTLAKQARGGRKMATSDVHSTLQWIRKTMAAKRRGSSGSEMPRWEARE